MQVAIAVVAGRRCSDGIDRGPRFGRIPKQSLEPISKVAPFLVEQVAEDLDDRPVVLGGAPASLLGGKALDHRSNRGRKRGEAFDEQVGGAFGETRRNGV